MKYTSHRGLWRSAFAGGLIFLSLQGVAQESRQLTLAEAISLGLSHSKELKMSDSRVQEAIASLSEAKDRQLPDLSISGQYMRVNRPNLDLKLALPEGEGGGEEAGTASTPNISQAMFGMATAQVPLFAGGSIRNGVESARFLKQATELDAQQNKQAVIQNTISAYYNLFKAQSASKLVEENLKTSRQRVKDFSNMERNGLLARNDLLKVQLQESNMELALLNAENNEKIANFNFNLMLGLDGQTQLQLDTTDLAFSSSPQNLTEWESDALSGRKDFQAAEQREQAAHAAVAASKGAYFPSIALTAGYVGINVPNALVLTNAVNVGAGLSYNLANLYKAGAKIRQAREREHQATLVGEQLNDQIRSQVHQSYQAYHQNLKKIQVYQKAVEQANENYRITRNKYDNALATTTDLLDADVARLQARLDFEYAKADAAVAQGKLYESAGKLETPVASQNRTINQETPQAQIQ